MASRDDLKRAILACRGSPSFEDFIKTLQARREHVDTQLVDGLDTTQTEVLRGEVRAYDFILKAHRQTNT
jgi:hypothetical protein